MPNWKKLVVSGSDAALNSLNVSTNVNSPSFTGSLYGTASWANNSLTASYFSGSVESAVSASYAQTASVAIVALTSSFFSGSVESAVSASYATSASYVKNADSASYVLTAESASFASTASLPLRGVITASVAGSNITFTKGDNTTFSVSVYTSTVDTASYVTSSNVDGPLGKNSVLSASYALTSSHAVNITISGSITNVDHIDFNTGSSFVSTPGRLGWDSGENTLQLGLAGGNVQYSMGEQIYQYVHNAEPTSLTKGQVVYISGSQGNKIAVKLAADNSDRDSASTLGLVAETIASGGDGWIITEGTLRKLNTLGLEAGKLLFLGSTPGTYTQTPPTAPSHSVRLGYVERVSATVGSIYVKIDNGYEIGELHDVIDTTTTSSYGDLFIKSGSVWHNSRQLTGSYGLTGSLTATAGGFTGSLQGTASWATQAITASHANFFSVSNNAVVSGSLTVLQNLTVFGSASITYITESTLNISTNLITVNTNTPAIRFGGLAVIDSGSSPSVSGSWLFDSEQDRWIFIHQQQPGSIITSSIAIMGPETYGDLGNETQITLNRLTKGYSGMSGEHIGDSQVSDDGTTVSIPGNLVVTGSIVGLINSASFAVTASYVLSAVSSSFATSASRAISADTASYVLSAVSSSFATSASRAISADTASYVLNAVSASFATSASQAISASYVLNSVSSSHAVSASYAQTASYAVRFDVSQSFTASGLRYPTADNGNESYIQTDGAGNLSLQYVKSMYESVRNREASSINSGTPLFVSGATGANSDVYIADASNPARMPATYIASETIASGATGKALISGLLTNFNTTAYQAGQEIFVATGSGITTSRPPYPNSVQLLGIITRVGVNGQAVILNPGQIEIQNIQPGYVLVGNNVGTPTAVATSSLSVATASFVTASGVYGPYGHNSILSASFAQTASYVFNAVSASFAQTASYVLNAVSASFATTASYAVSASQAQNAVTASYILNAVSASFASTASSADNFTVRGTLTAQTIVVQTITSSTDFVTGSTRFGTLLSNTHQFTGSVSVTGSLTVVGAGITGSLFGTASWANNAISSSYALSASQAQNAVSSSYPIFATGSSIYSHNAQKTNPNNIIAIGLDAFSGSTGVSSIAIGQEAGLGSLNVDQNVYIGNESGKYSHNNSGDIVAIGAWRAGYSASLARGAVFLGKEAGRESKDVQFSIFIGDSAGYIANNSDFSIAIGNSAGSGVTNTDDTISIGESAGSNVQNSSKSIFIGSNTGVSSNGTNNSIFIGQNVGQSASGSNNIIIGKYLSLSPGRSDSINIGGLIYGTGSYSGTSIFSGSNDGRIGINQSLPLFSLDVSGSGRYTNGLQVTGSLNAPIITGSLFGTASWANNAVTASYVLNAVSASFAITASYVLNSVTSSFSLNAATASNVLGGAANYVPLWNGATTLSSSVIYQSAGNIGIANTASSYRLDVSGDTRTLGNLRVGFTGSSNEIRFYGTSGDGPSSYNHSAIMERLWGSTDQSELFLFKGNDPDACTNCEDQVRIASAGRLVFHSANTYYDVDSYLAAFPSNRTGSMYVDGNNIFVPNGNLAIGKTSTVARLDVSGNAIVTGSLTVTQGITSSLFGTASWATQAFTASYSSNFTVESQLTIDATLTDYATVATSTLGSNTVFNQATGSYTSAFFKYTVSNGSNSRAGEVVATWNGTSVQYYENSTVDIGATNAVTSSVSIVGSNVQFNVQTNTSGWRIKSLATFM